jgi:predicted CXXCH cytochrome family protein
MNEAPRSGRLFSITVFLILAVLAACAGTVTFPPLEPMIRGADFSGTETCALCHEEIVRDFAKTDHGRLFLSGREGVQGCESCHGAGSLHVEAGGGRGVHIVDPDRNPHACFRCHLSAEAQFGLQYRHPVREKRMTCSNCHNPHGQDIRRPKGAFASGRNLVCMQCHREQARPRVFEHEAPREGCTICHNAHGSISEKLLVERDNNLCLKCHGQVAAPGSVVIGDFNHTNFLSRGTCWSAGCHTAVHGSDINAHLRY